MKTLFSTLMALCMMMSLQACSTDETNFMPEESENNTRPDESDSDGNNGNTYNSGGSFRVRITFGSHELTALFYDNATSNAFKAKLPVTLPILDLYSREMCYRFPEALPANEAGVRGYEVSEIVYYPPRHSFVIMYRQNGERFNMQTMGRVESNVALFNNVGDIDVTFELLGD